MSIFGIFSRRQLLSGFAATSFGRMGVSKLDAEEAAANDNSVINITSPKDGYIATVLVNLNQKVNVADLLCTLNNEDEIQAQTRLTTAQNILDIESQKLSDSAVANQRMILQIGLDLANQYRDLMTQKRDAIQVLVTANLARPLELIPPEAAVTKSIAEVEKATIALTKFDFNLTQAKAKLDLAKNQLASEKDYLSKKLDHLNIKALVSGTVTSVPIKNAFVMRGDVICKIKL